jgi:hypothetical protein
MANTELLQQYRDNRLITDPKFFKLVNNTFMMNLFLLSKLPAGLFIGAKIKHIDTEECQITVPYRWGNNNPFRSTYFGVLATAAEISTGLLGLLNTYNAKPSISMLVTRMEADFTKKATGITTFTCKDGKEMANAVEQAILTGEPKTFDALTIGTSQTGEEEARFKIYWSFKARI